MMPDAADTLSHLQKPQNGLDWDDGKISHLPRWVQQPILSAAHSIGMPSSILLFVFMQFFAIVVACYHRKVTSTRGRHLYSIAFGSFFLIFTFGWGSIHMFVLSAIVYAVIPLLPLGYINAVVFVISLGYLSCCHIWNMWHAFGVWTVDVTAPLMILALKLIAFAQNYSDGLYLDKNVKLHEKDSLHSLYKNRAISQYPSIIEFASFCLFYGTMMSGPFTEIKPYLAFIDQSMFKEAGYSSAPSSTKATLAMLYKALLMYGLVFISGFLPLQGYANTKDFIIGTSFLYRLLYLLAAVPIYRSKYYFSWCLGDAACIACGYGFNGVIQSNKEGQPPIVLWNRHDNSRITRVEFSRNIQDLADNWNPSVADCLKYYVYFRVRTPKAFSKVLPGSRVFAMLVTRLTSAFWHGFYPSYYAFFTSVILINEFDKCLKRHFLPMTSAADGKPIRVRAWVYDLFSRIMTFALMNYFGTAFTLLFFSDALFVWSSVYWCGHIFCVLFMALCSILPRPKHKVA